ncbi:MAG: ComEA family DNA-binding protein [Gemmatimonadaceae bacterium]
MPTKSERQALAFFAVVTVLGVGVRMMRSDPPPVPTIEERLALASQLAATDSAAGAAAERKRGKGRGPRRPPAASSGPERLSREETPANHQTNNSFAPVPASPAAPAPVDLDHASQAELERLPWVGPALAARIVADREAHGPFGSVEGLVRVRGVGPKLAERLRPLVTFGGPARPRNAAPGGAVTRAGERLWVPAGHPPRP